MLVKVFRSLSVPTLDGLEGYVSAVASRVCPHLRPSIRMQATRWSVYEFDQRDERSAEAVVFGVGLLHAELLRCERRHSDRGASMHACENVVFTFPNDDAIDGRALFEWPHWLLKNAYTRKSVLFGKFWKGESQHGRTGELLPIPPCHPLSIRSAMPRKDEQFFQKASELLPDLRGAEDDGEWPAISVSKGFRKAVEQVVDGRSRLSEALSAIVDESPYQRLYDEFRQQE